MVQSYDPQTGVLFLNAVSGTGVTVEQALDAVMAALTEGANIVIANNDATNTITIGTSALNQAQVDDRIMDQLPTATSFQATSTSNTNRLAWTPERVMQSARVAMTGRTDNAPLDLSDPASESNINFTSRRTITQTIADNMGGSGSDDGVVDSATLAIVSDSILTLTLGRTVGADIVSPDLNLPFNHVTDADLDITTPANEPTNVGASRQAIAEAIARPGSPSERQPMLGLPLASDGRTGHPRGSHALLSPVVKRLRPTAIPVSANPAMAKGADLLRKTAR